MANYNNLKTAIQDVIKENGYQEIKGDILQNALLSMINSLGAGYQFIGVATPKTNPGAPDQKVFYIANGKGTYTNFGGISITEDEIVILYYDTAWHKLLTGIASQEKLTELESLIPNDASSLNKLLPTSELFDISSNRFDTSAMTANKYINVDGSETTSTKFSVTDYIPVSEGETIYFWCLRGATQGYMLFDERFLCAYDSSKQPLSDKGGTFISGTYVVPSGVSFIRASIDNTYLSNWTNFYCGTKNTASHEYEPYGKIFKEELLVQTNQSLLDLDGRADSLEYDVDEFGSRIDDMLKDVTKIPSSKNVFNGNLEDGYYVTSAGVKQPLANFSITDKLYCSAGQTIRQSYSLNGVRTQGTFRFVCFYDKNGGVVSGGGDSEISSIVVPEGAVSMIVTIRNAQATDLCIGNLAEGDLNYYQPSYELSYDYSTSSPALEKRVSALEEKVIITDTTTGIVAAIKNAYAAGVKKVIVRGGNYDLIQEYKDYFSASYFDNYENYATSEAFDRGIWLQNIEVVFEVGAKVVCKYEGSNQNVIDYFSAFACGNNVTIDGLVLETKNLRYGIHPDFNSTSNVTTMVLRNCDLNSYRDNDSTNKAIGAGLGIHVDWLFENCIFRTKYDGYAVRIHNNVSVDAYSKVQFIGCYFGDKGSVIMNSYSTSTHLSPCIMHGNSWKVAPTLGKETSDSNVNIQMLMYNNEKR